MFPEFKLAIQLSLKKSLILIDRKENFKTAKYYRKFMDHYINKSEK